MTETRNTRQRQILEWANKTFGKSTADNTGERIRRFAEEAIELAQAVGLDKQAMIDIIEHVYAKMPGNVAQEIGQVGVSLLGLAEHLNIQADEEESKEFERIKSLPADHWQARKNAKADKGIALMSTATGWYRDDIATFTTLCLVDGHNVTIDDVINWSDEQCRQAEEWAGACHFCASDNNIDVPEMPAHVRACVTVKATPEESCGSFN
ncbi:hypothetical protein V3O24_04460 [Methylobacter sp. Wu8]|uniref:hypothetical protein n=1 Tax=Methylobacter sp. Wu8 TaxID=3118457 RepID=UPI002F31D2DA